MCRRSSTLIKIIFSKIKRAIGLMSLLLLVFKVSISFFIMIRTKHSKKGITMASKFHKKALQVNQRHHSESAQPPTWMKRPEKHVLLNWISIWINYNNLVTSIFAHNLSVCTVSRLPKKAEEGNRGYVLNEILKKKKKNW